jgi:hypothetical protein
MDSSVLASVGVAEVSLMTKAGMPAPALPEVGESSRKTSISAANLMGGLGLVMVVL